MECVTTDPKDAIAVTSRGPLRGTLRVPGDKSVSHRSLMLAGIAHGTSTITGLSAGDDVRHTRQIMQAMGVEISEAPDADNAHSVGTLTVEGRDLSEPTTDLDVGNSGTAARLLAGLCAGQNYRSLITGDESIPKRPMGRVVEPLRAMGASIEGRDGGQFTPLVIRGGGLTGIDYTTPVASAQVKSAVLLAGLFAEGTTVVREKVATRRHTEEMLAEHGVAVSTEPDAGGGAVVTLAPGPVKPGAFEVPGDPSQAAFWICAAAAVPGSDVTVENLYLAPERSGFLDVLRAMGADLEIDRAAGRVRARGRELHGTVVTGEQLSDLIDEVPALAVAGALATTGSLEFQDAGELRTKESDRIDSVAAMLQVLGGEVDTRANQLVIHASSLRSGAVDSHGDHRIAMAAAVASSALPEGSAIEIDAWGCVATSYPGFVADLASLTKSA